MASDDQWCLKALGKIRAKIFLRRLSDLKFARNLEDVRFLPGHYHELVGDRKGEWACDLDQPYRMVFVPHENPIPTDDKGRFVWVEIKGIEIIEIIDYHSKH